MSTLNIPVPTISTGPKRMTDTEAAEHYLREMRDRTKMLQAGSGVTALVNRLLDDVLDAMEALNTSTDTPTPERVTLTDEDDSTLADWWVSQGGDYEDLAIESLTDVVGEIVAAREQALREEVAQEIEDLIVTLHQSQDDFDRGWFGAVEHAASIARGGAR